MSFVDYVDRLRRAAESDEEVRHTASQLLSLNAEALHRPNGMFLELGTDRGQGSRALLAACEQNGASLVSIDIRDCSKAVVSDRWTFVQASSVDRDLVISKAPELLEGIDIVYVDSLHTPDHVQNEVYTWFPLLKKGGIMFFDDVDSGPYLAGARKDNAGVEISNRLIRKKLEEIFYANPGRIDFNMTYGSTGLGAFHKHNEMGEGLSPPVSVKHRHSVLFSKILSKLGRRTYRHQGDGSDYSIPLS